MDTELECDEMEEDDSELTLILENSGTISKNASIYEKRHESDNDFINLHNVFLENNDTDVENSCDINPLFPQSVKSTRSLSVSSNDENDEDIIQDIELIAPTAAVKTNMNALKLDTIIMNCIQDENVKNNLFRLNEQLESNINKCRIVTAEAKVTLCEKTTLIKQFKQIEEKVMKYSVEEAKMKKIKKRKGKDCAVTGHNKITYFCRFGIPYFKCKQRFPADYNEDYREIINSNQITLFRLPKTRRFLRKDAQNLEKLALQQLKEKRIQRLKTYLRDLDENIENNDCKTDEFYEKKKKLCDAILETSNISSLNETKDWNVEIDFTSLAEPINYRYSAEDYERIWNLLAKPSLSREDFTEEESSQLRTLAIQHKAQDWDRIAQLLGTSRTGFMCFTKYATMVKKGVNVPWTSQENELLRDLCSQLYGIKKPGLRHHWWKNIRRHFPHRTFTQIHAHWNYVLAPKLKKGRFSDEEHNAVEQMVKDGKSFSEIAKIFRNRSCVQVRSHYESQIKCSKSNRGTWTKDEENILLELVGKYGNKNWVLISEQLKTRTRAQCRLKYAQLKKLSSIPTSECNSESQNRKGRWTEEEDRLFTQLISEHGHKWAEISKIMKTRTRRQCRFKYLNDPKFSHQKKKIQQFTIKNKDQDIDIG